MDMKKIIRAAIGLLILVIALDAIAFFTIIFLPDTPFTNFLARHEPFFNLLKQRIATPTPQAIEGNYYVREHTVNYRFVDGIHTVKIGANVSVFSDPSWDSKASRRTEREYNLEVLEEQGSWLKVHFPFGQGWINPGTLYAGASSLRKNAESSSEPVSLRESRKLEWKHNETAVYVDFIHINQRPLMFDELDEEANPLYLTTSAINLNLHRLRLVTEAMGEDFVQKKSGPFIIRGKSTKLVRDAAIVLRNFRGNYRSVFSKVIKTPKAESMIYVYILPDMKAYQKFYPGGRYEVERTSGHYETGIIVTYPDPDHKTTLRVLIHEATHHFNKIYLGINDTVNSTWLDEGLATYIGLSGFTSENKLKPGEINLFLAKRRGARASTGTPAGMAFYLINKIRGGKSLDIERVIGSLREDFYTKNSVFNYSVSWMVVHYFLHAEGGRYRAGFFDFLKQARLGNSGMEQLERSTGLSVYDLKRKLRNHILALDR